MALASVRAQAEKTRPPRALWTAAPLGRPVGEPSDPAFQLRVLRAALALLERTDGPVILEDFPEDPPGLVDTADWTMPEITPAASFAAATEWEAAFAAELAKVRPLWQAAQSRFGRTSVGLSFQVPEMWPTFAGAILDGKLPLVTELGTTGPITSLPVRRHQSALWRSGSSGWPEANTKAG